jgi:parallel beta-helix repeat protein
MCFSPGQTKSIKGGKTMKASTVLLGIIIILSVMDAAAQGALTPPGAPAPTMKTLTQLEPRTPIASVPFVISNSGSYYLTTNLTGTSGTNGITITVDNVTLDLNGFGLIGVTGSSNGVFASSVLRNVAVRNGTLRNWGRFGVDIGNVNNGQLLDLRLSDNGNGGARAGNYATILRCVAEANSQYGLYGGNGSLIKDSTAGFNTGTGIRATFYATIIDCSVTENKTNGIVTSSYCNIRGCTVSANTGIGISTAGSCRIESCNASDNTGQGIYPNDHTTISHCTANGNNGDGITIAGFTSVTDCTASSNFGNGINATGDLNRIESNFVGYNGDRGIRLHAVNTSIVIRNTAVANGTGDIPAAGSNIGPAQSPATAANPAANFVM